MCYIIRSRRKNAAEEFLRRIMTEERMQEELYLIVDNGGCVCDVVVEHEIYGQLSADLILKNRRDVDEFVQKMGEICGSSH